LSYLHDRIADIPPEIRPEYHQNTNRELYWCTKQWGFLFLILKRKCD
jgi:hypothetical protein